MGRIFVLSAAMIGSGIIIIIIIVIVIVIAQGGIAHHVLRRLLVPRRVRDAPPHRFNAPPIWLIGLPGSAHYFESALEVLLPLADAIPNLQQAQRANVPYFGA